MINPKLQEFFEFIYDRHHIWYKKSFLKLESPWTDDPILQTYKFCNIYRELDKVSIVIDETICKSQELDFESKFFNILAGRVFNLDYTYSKMLGILDPRNFDHKYYEDLLDSKIKKGLGIWNSAYTVTQMKFDKNYRKEKHAQFLLMFDYVSKNIEFLTRGLRKCTSLREATLKLCKLPLIGEFLAGEIVQDLTYCRPFFFSNEMNDDHDLCTVGPGTLKSITETFSLENPTNETFTNLIKSTSDLQGKYFYTLKQQTGKDWNEIAYKTSNSPTPKLSINNIESAFCEIRKYNNLSNGSGRKRYYHK